MLKTSIHCPQKKTLGKNTYMRNNHHWKIDSRIFFWSTGRFTPFLFKRKTVLNPQAVATLCSSFSMQNGHPFHKTHQAPKGCTNPGHFTQKVAALQRMLLLKPTSWQHKKGTKSPCCSTYQISENKKLPILARFDFLRILAVHHHKNPTHK